MNALDDLLSTFAALLEASQDEGTDPPLPPYRADPGGPRDERAETAMRRYRLFVTEAEPEPCGASLPQRVRYDLRLEVPYPLARAPRTAASLFARETERVRRLADHPSLSSDGRVRLLVHQDSRIEALPGLWVRFSHRLVALVDHPDTQGEAE